MALGGNKLHFMRQRLFIPVTQFTGLVPYLEVQSSGAIGTNMEVGLSANTDAATYEGGTGITALRTLQATAPNVFGSAGAFTAASIPKLVELGALGVVALVMPTAGDDVRHLMLIPSTWNRKHPIYVRCIWSTDSATIADTIDWKFLYLAVTPDLTELIAPATALDTVIPQDTVPVATAKVINRTAQGKINARTIADAALYLAFICEMDAKAAGLSEDVFFHGVEFEYTPHFGPLNAVDDVEGEAWKAA